VRKGIWTTIGVLAAALGTAPSPAQAECPLVMYAYHHGTVIFSEQGHETRVRVEIADTQDKQEYGLMCRTVLDPDAGMLFVFDFSSRTSFWMKNTLIPLSIAFIDSNWRIVGVMDMLVAPDPADPPASAVYTPKKPYRYALEVNLGFFAQHGIDEHAQVRFVPEESRGDPRTLRSLGLPQLPPLSGAEARRLLIIPR